jgi:hypothetical protein
MKVGQNRPAVPTQSTTSTEARKGTTAAPAQAPTARGASTFQTGFDTAVRKNTFTVQAAATPLVMTPAPPPENGTPGKPAPITDDQLRKVLTEAHQLIFGRDVDQNQLAGWMNRARTLRDTPEDPTNPTKLRDLDGIKYSLFTELRTGKTLEQQQKTLDEPALKKLVNDAYQLFAGPGEKPDAGKAKELLDFATQLRDHPEDPTKPLDADGIKYALFSKLRGTYTDPKAAITDTKLKDLVGQAYELFAGPGEKPDAGKAKELLDLATQLRDKPADPDKPLDADGIKYALFSKLRGTYNSDPKAKITDDELRKLLNEANNLVFGNDANGPHVEAWMNRARTLRDTPEDPNEPTRLRDRDGIKYALFRLMRQVK